MNVLSLFDGMSCGQIALNRLGIEYDTYYASEIDKYAIQVAKKNYPNTIHIGDVTKVKAEDIGEIDLLLGGSPCQGFSFAGNQLNFQDPRSKLFFEYVRLLNELKPKYFLLENVKMKKQSRDIISQHLGVEPIEINSALVSAQKRSRLYWTNIPGIDQPKDKGILLRDIIEGDVDPKFYASQKFVDRINRYKNGDKCFDNSNKAMCLVSGYHKMGRDNTYIVENQSATPSGKSYCLTATYSKAAAWNSCEKKQRTMIPIDTSNKVNPNIYNGVRYRKMTPVECERLQTVPDNYTDGVSNTQRYKMLGNGWTIDVITHILKNIL